MPEEDPLYRMLQDLADLYNKVQANMHKEITVTPEIKARLDNLVNYYQRFQDLNMVDIEKAGIKIENLQKIIETLPGTLSPEVKKTLEYSKELRQEVENMRLKVAMQSGMIPEDQKEPTDEKSKKKQIRKRQQKFKRVGGDQNWLPM